MLQVTRRTIELHEVFNFRDLGGLPTGDGGTIKTGTIFRADGLHRLSEPDSDVLAPFGLRTVIDLRTDAEVERWGHAPGDITGAEVHHLSVLKETWDREAVDHAVDAADFLSARYLEMLDQGQGALASALRLIADEGRHGVVFHCAAGKDRTGVLAALVLATAGVSDDDIAIDYAATAPNMLKMQEWIKANNPEFREIMAQQPPAFMACPPEAMHRFLDAVTAEWGSVPQMIGDHLGLSADELSRLRRAVLA